MNSFTKPPSRKFQFDTDFDQEAERLRVEMLRQQEVVQADGHAAAHYGEGDLQSARQESFDLGFQQGQNEAKQTLEQTLAELNDRISTKLHHLIEEENTRVQQARHIALTTTVATLKKLWPSLIQKSGLKTVEDMLRQSLEINSEEPRIVVRIHDSMIEDVVKCLPQIKEQQAFAGKVIVLADDHVTLGDCKVEWADGGLEYLSRYLSRQLDDALNRILASLPDNKSNSAIHNETERTSS